MLRYLPPRSPLTWVIVGAVLCLLASSILPPLYNNQTRPLPTDLDFTVTSAPTTGKLMDIESLMSNQAPKAHRDNPDCQARPSPMYCYVDDSELRLSRTTTTAKAAPGAGGVADAEDTVAESSSLLKVDAEGKIIAEFSESSLLNRESTYPIPGPVTNQKISIPHLQTGVETPNYERDGLNYFFPSGTEQRSYPFYDELTQESYPIDYTGDIRLDGVPTYSYHHAVDPVPLRDVVRNTEGAGASRTGETSSDDMQMSGPAWRFFDDEDLRTYNLARNAAVVMEPYYAVSRDVWVEPTTGTIVDQREHIDVFFAADARQAQAMLEAGDTAARSLFAMEAKWSDDSRSERLSQVKPTITTIKALSVVSVVGKLAGVALLFLAASMFMRRRRAH